MANELEGYGAPDSTTYALIKKRGLFWNGTTFVTYATASRGDYDVPLTELGTSSGMYQADFPSDITDSGSYSYAVYQTETVGTAPSEEDRYIGGGTVDWTGAASIATAPGSMSGSDFYDYVLRTFKRDDKSTEVYEAITDTIRDLRLRYHFDEATADAVTTDSITVAGDFKIELEDTLGMLLGVTVQDGENASPLILVTKQQFDLLYSDINVNSNYGYPRHYCVFAGSIYIGPCPDSTAYTYRLSYSTRGGTVSSSTTAVPFTAVDRELVKHGTLSRLYILMEEPNLAAVHEALFEKRFSINVDRERKNKGEGSFLVNPFTI